MSNLDVALASFWQLARHWQQGDAAKIEMSCEAGSLNTQLNAKLGHPDLRKEGRRHAAKTNIQGAKSTQNLSAEDFAPSKEAENPKKSFLEHENPQYSSDISPMRNTEKPSQLLSLTIVTLLMLKAQ